MDRETLLALAERCEKAIGTSLQLDADIHEGITTFFPRRAGPGWPDENALVVPNFPGWVLLPNYTGSLDMALSLVPGDMRDEIEITTLYMVARVAINLNHGANGSPFYGSNECNSIPLAICSAALKARAYSSTAPAGSSPSDGSISSQVASMPDMPASSATSCQATEEGE